MLVTFYIITPLTLIIILSTLPIILRIIHSVAVLSSSNLASDVEDNKSAIPLRRLISGRMRVRASVRLRRRNVTLKWHQIVFELIFIWIEITPWSRSVKNPNVSTGHLLIPSLVLSHRLLTAVQANKQKSDCMSKWHSSQYSRPDSWLFWTNVHCCIIYIVVT